MLGWLKRLFTRKKRPVRGVSVTRTDDGAFIDDMYSNRIRAVRETKWGVTPSRDSNYPLRQPQSLSIIGLTQDNVPIVMPSLMDEGYLPTGAVLVPATLTEVSMPDMPDTPVPIEASARDLSEPPPPSASTPATTTSYDPPPPSVPTYDPPSAPAYDPPSAPASSSSSDGGSSSSFSGGDS